MLRVHIFIIRSLPPVLFALNLNSTERLRESLQLQGDVHIGYITSYDRKSICRQLINLKIHSWNRTYSTSMQVSNQIIAELSYLSGIISPVIRLLKLTSCSTVFVFSRTGACLSWLSREDPVQCLRESFT